MVYRASFASSDGKVINQHFGHARQFLVAEIDEEHKNWKYIETRVSVPACVNGNHSDSGLEDVCILLQDCRAVFAARIGPGALAYLAQYGIQGMETPYMIEEVLHALVNSKLKIVSRD